MSISLNWGKLPGDAGSCSSVTVSVARCPIRILAESIDALREGAAEADRKTAKHPASDIILRNLLIVLESMVSASILE